MAITTATYTGNGSTTLYSFSFPYLDAADIKVKVNTVLQTTPANYTFANATTIQFVTAPANGAEIQIYRATDIENNQATFYPGSSIRAQDLNDNFDQGLYSLQEIGDRYLDKYNNPEFKDDLDMNAYRIVDLGAPVNGTDAATKAYADTKLGLSGGTVTGNLEIGTTGTLTFEGSTADGFETTLGVINPTADRTINLPNTSGTLLVDDGSGVTLSGTITAGAFVPTSSTPPAYGIYAASPGTVTVAMNGNPRVFIAPNDVTVNTNAGIPALNVSTLYGRVGIGTGSPLVKFEVFDPSDAELSRLSSNGTQGVQQTFVVNNSYIGGVGSAKYWDATLSRTDVGLASNANLDFLTNQLFRARITSAGNFGINDSAPDAKLTVNGVASFGAGTAALPSIAARGDLDTGIWFPTANTTAISTGGSERFRIDGSGRLLINTDSAFTNYYIGASASTPQIQLTGTSNDVASMVIHNRAGAGTSGGANAGRLHLVGGALGSVSNSTNLIANDSIGQLIFSGIVDGSTSIARNGASIQAQVEGVPTTTSIPTSLTFSTTASNSVTASERLRITSAGLVGVGTSAPSYLITAQGTTASINVKEPGDNSTARVTRYIWSFDDGDGASINATRNTGTTAADVYLTFRTGGITNAQERMRINSSGNVGINDTAPDARLTVNGIASFGAGAAATPSIAARGDLDTGIYFPAANTIAASTNGTEGLRLTSDKVICYNQPAPASFAAAATLTVADLKTGIIEYTGAAATLTLPTGTLTEGGFSGVYTNMTFEWSLINTGSGTATLGAGTNHTIVGLTTCVANNSARFATRRTAANTFVSYRIS